MRAVTFGASKPGFVSARTLGRAFRRTPFGRLGSVRLADLPEPEVEHGDWVGIAVDACGICGSDLSIMTYEFTLALEPFVSFPAVMGHEIIGHITELGHDVGGLEIGQRVAVDPMLSCETRGFRDRCGACSEGLPAMCRRAGEPGLTTIGGHPINRGNAIGFHSDLPGGYSEKIVAHRSQVHPIPDRVPDDVAVLTEPLSIGVHAVARTRGTTKGPVLVIGSGAVALGVVWALRMSGFEGEIIAQVKRPHETDAAERAGADEVISPDTARSRLLTTGAKAYKPMLGAEVYADGGFPTVFDCIGSRSSIDQSLRYSSTGGTIVLLGCVGPISGIDMAFIWARELRMLGFLGYGMEHWEDREVHTYELTHRWMEDKPEMIEGIVTHRFPLVDYRQAFEVSADHGKHESIKVTLAS